MERHRMHCCAEKYDANEQDDHIVIDDLNKYSSEG